MAVDFSRAIFEADASFRQAAFTETTVGTRSLFRSFRFTASRSCRTLTFGSTFDENVDFSEHTFTADVAGPAAVMYWRLAS